ncbi:YheC/YheD family protein [Paenibacillus sp. ACRRX]|uniref:YheC/YheD family endospore coat-associated protein n=1 Tax=Paenibacillus sp. ACRRX TaxID=2918206 RepID=UPI0031BAC359
MTQPILGILTLYMNEQKQLEERPVYQKMIAAGKKLGIEVFVFTPQDVNEQMRKIHALVYNPDNNRWSRKWMKFPHLIFDRCRLQSSYRFEQLRKFRTKYHHLHFMNRPLRNKWTIYQVLGEDAEIHLSLPKTKLYSSVADVQQMIKRDPVVYLKPINGTGGRGILRIERLKSSSQTVFVQGRDHQRRIIKPQKMTWSQLTLKLASWHAKERYLVQQGISLNLPNGRVHDYRMLVQKDGSGQWTVTGCAARIGAAKSITSNLHGGGEAVRMDTLLRQWIGDEKRINEVKANAEQLGVAVARFLEKKYGALCELALDLAIERNGKIWLLEVNPKPAREVFARIGDRDTYRLALSRPLEYAIWLYENKVSPDARTREPKHSNKEIVSKEPPANEEAASTLKLSGMPPSTEPFVGIRMPSRSNRVKKTRSSTPAYRRFRPYYPFYPLKPSARKRPTRRHWQGVSDEDTSATQPESHACNHIDSDETQAILDIIQQSKHKDSQ